MSTYFAKVVLCPCCGGTGKLSQIDGAALRKVREGTGISLRALARQLGFSAAYLSDIELGRRMCTGRILEAYKRLQMVNERNLK